MRADAPGPGAAGVDERWGVLGAIVFVLVSLVLIATLPPASEDPRPRAAVAPPGARS
jgi:hypothetical protein